MGDRDRAVSVRIESVLFAGGNDEYIPGVPARNLDPQEWAGLPDFIKKKCLETGLYKIEYEDPESGDGPEPSLKE